MPILCFSYISVVTCVLVVLLQYVFLFIFIQMVGYIIIFKKIASLTPLLPLNLNADDIIELEIENLELVDDNLKFMFF